MLRPAFPIDYEWLDPNGLLIAFLRVHLLEQLLPELWRLLQEVLEAVDVHVVGLRGLHIGHLDSQLGLALFRIGLVGWLLQPGLRLPVAGQPQRIRQPDWLANLNGLLSGLRLPVVIAQLPHVLGLRRLSLRLCLVLPCSSLLLASLVGFLHALEDPEAQLVSLNVGLRKHIERLLLEYFVADFEDGVVVAAPLKMPHPYSRACWLNSSLFHTTIISTGMGTPTLRGSLNAQLAL